MSTVLEPTTATQEVARTDRDAAPPPRGRSRWRRALLVCMVVGMVHGLVWTVINPPLQGPDEFTHADQVTAMDRLLGADHYVHRGDNEIDVLIHGVPFSADGDPTWSPKGSTVVRRLTTTSRWTGYEPSYGVNNPPLYYLYDALIVRPFASENLLDRLWIMRVGNLLLFAATIAFCFLFVRELLPRHPWAWTLAGLAVALQPLTAFMAGSVSVDNLLFATSAALFYFIARAFRRGLSIQLGAAIGLSAFLGSVTKSSTFAFVPPMLLALCALAIWAWRDGRRRDALGFPVGFAMYLLPLYGWVQVNTHLLNRPGSTTTGGYAAPSSGRLHYIESVLSYTWQVFFPRLPFMHDQYQNYFNSSPPFPAFPQYPLWQTWLQGFVGRFGWHQQNFSDWVNVPAGVVFATVGVLAVWAVWKATGHLGRRRIELLTYVLMAVSAFMLITIAGYGWRKSRGGLSFEQARYLLPLLPLYGGVLACAAVGLRKRWGRMLAGVLVVLAVAHSLGAIILVLGRYYS